MRCVPEKVTRLNAMTEGPVVSNPSPTPMPRALLCPYCGAITADVHKCTACGGHLDALSRQATQNAMGPWYLRDEQRPHHPGCSYETLCRLIEQGRVTPETVIRGPTTGQFWMLARRVPGIAHRLGVCHSCQAPAKPDDYACRSCGAVFQGERDRQHLGLGPIRPLPGQQSPQMVAARLSVTMPAIPTPMPGVGKRSAARNVAGNPATNNSVRGEVERLRRLEKRIVVLRNRLIGSLSANIVLACALLVAVTLLAIRQGDEQAASARPPLRDPIIVGPSMEQAAEQAIEPQPDVNANPEAEQLPEGPAPGAEEMPGQIGMEPGESQRELDITLMSWPDAEAYLRARVDIHDAQSLIDGLAMLKAYEDVVGLPESGQQLRSAWEFRLEQLKLQGMP
ncbi:MAG: hypothetical protein Kow0022_11060 [Phycisphaerales bacterium]